MVSQSGKHTGLSVTALSDAAILYGAQRYFDGLHDKEGWLYHSQYRKEDDKSLFLEFLHNLCLYDRVVLDNRPIEDAERSGYGELNRFLSYVNKEMRDEVFVADSLALGYDEQARAGASSRGKTPTAVQDKVCRLVTSYVVNDQTAKLDAIKVPWAYHQPFHQDWAVIACGLRRYDIDEHWIPFTLFVWRAVWYGAIARFQAKKSKRPFAYVAAPRRIAALEAIFNSKTIAAFQFPREAVRAISWELPEVPSAGYDFSYLDFVSAFEVSALSEGVADMSPQDALAFVIRFRKSRQALAMRKDWANIILEGASTCAVGETVIQIMRDMTVYGNASQTVRLRALPA